jgi:hypothetical protein
LAAHGTTSLSPTKQENEAMKFSQATAMAAFAVASTFAACDSDGASSTEPSIQATPRQAPMSTTPRTSEGNNPEKNALQAAKTMHAHGQLSPQWPEHNVDKLRSFATENKKNFASATGDLNGDSKPDELVVLDSSTNENKNSDGRDPRTVLLLIRDTNGSLREMAKNDKIVPCSECGGSLGDPFGYIRIDNNLFVIAIEGGSRWRWSSEYTFGYATEMDDWIIQKVDRGVYDSISQETVSRTFTPDDFGRISFSDFDPSTIPEVVLP